MSARSRQGGLLPVVLLLIAAAIFAALGAWQLQRRSWKLHLVAAMEQRIHAPPIPAPPPPAWRRVSAEDAYHHVQLRGAYLPGSDTLVQAVTEGGPGFWVMTPLRTEAGWTALVNRGFVPSDRRDLAGERPDSRGLPLLVTGLLRLSEPKGGFLRSNCPTQERWYSRDVAAIARAKALGPVAPYFVDVDAASGAAAEPVGGLTVTRLPNSHLVYALTWFSLAGMSLAGLWVVRRERRSHPSR